MKRGQVYQVRLDPIEGTEQAGIRPVVIVSRDAINASSKGVIGIPCTTLKPGKKIYRSQVMIRAPEGGLDEDSKAMAEQVRVLSKSRLLRLRGVLTDATMAEIDRALLVALDLSRSV